MIVEAIDFSVLGSLSFRDSNFNLNELKILVGRISDNGNFELPMATLVPRSPSVVSNIEMNNISEQFERLKTIMP